MSGGEARLKGNVRHSVVQWCFAKYWSVDQTCRIAKQLGIESVEIVAPEHYPTLQKYGLRSAIAGSHLFVQGMNNPKYHPMCLEILRRTIDESAAAGVPTVITFTGFAQDTGEPADGKIPDFSRLPANLPVISPEDGIKNCVAGFKQIVGYAEQKKVNLSLEMLNTRVDEEMKGHPGYQGDSIEYCLEIIKQVGSPRLGLLFDIYHVQIMQGDLITRWRSCHEYVNHVHTAGNPGRCELDAAQEINYPAVMRALVDVGYKGFVGHEFIPTRDPLEGLREAVQVCDV
ncbi:MAG: TIM barrel protein [Pirellulales bacterium]